MREEAAKHEGINMTLSLLRMVANDQGSGSEGRRDLHHYSIAPLLPLAGLTLGISFVRPYRPHRCVTRPALRVCQGCRVQGLLAPGTGAQPFLRFRKVWFYKANASLVLTGVRIQRWSVATLALRE